MNYRVMKCTYYRPKVTAITRDLLYAKVLIIYVIVIVLYVYTRIQRTLVIVIADFRYFGEAEVKRVVIVCIEETVKSGGKYWVCWQRKVYNWSTQLKFIEYAFGHSSPIRYRKVATHSDPGWDTERSQKKWCLVCDWYQIERNNCQGRGCKKMRFVKT